MSNCRECGFNEAEGESNFCSDRCGRVWAEEEISTRREIKNEFTTKHY